MSSDRDAGRGDSAGGVTSEGDDVGREDMMRGVGPPLHPSI